MELSVALVLVLAAVDVPFVVLAMRAWRRARARRAHESRLFAQAAREELLALGDEIVQLDLDVVMSDIDPRAREECVRALEHYERANRALNHAQAAQRATEVAVAAREGRRHVEAVRKRSGAPPASSAPTTALDVALLSRARRGCR